MTKQNPPYKFLSEDEKMDLGYLVCKRTAMTICRYEKIRRLFGFYHLKEAFQWFDKENLLDVFSQLYYTYRIGHNYSEKDSEIYSLTDFLIFFINFEPELFSKIITEAIKLDNLFSQDVQVLNNIFSPLGYVYQKGFFYSSFRPSERAKINDFLSEKLKNINEDLYITWGSIYEEIVSNNSDKATNISAKSRKVINLLLQNLTPNLEFKSGDPDQIKKRLQDIFNGNEKNIELIEKVANLITILNQTQSKGDHCFVDEQTSIFVFNITEMILFFILSHKK